MSKWELVVVWETGETDVYQYTTEEEATEAGHNMEMAFGKQIAWHGTRKGNTE